MHTVVSIHRIDDDDVTEVACNDDSVDGVQAAIEQELVGGEDYLFRVAGYGDAGGSLRLTFGRGLGMRFRSRASAVILVVVSVVAGSSTGVSVQAQEQHCEVDRSWGSIRAAWAAEVVDLTNAHRSSRGLQPLKVSRSLTRAAVWKASHMAGFDYFDHDDPAPPVARTWDQRIEDCGYPYGAGENIAAGYANPQDVLEGWLDSPGHRANIEGADYEVIGVGATTDDAGTTYWVQVFGLVDDSDGDQHNPPEAVHDVVESFEDETVRLDVTANDSDADGDPIEVTVVQGAIHGSIELGSGAVIYQPEPNFYGHDNFSYEIVDLFGYSATASADVTVAAVNDDPVAETDHHRVEPRRQISIDVLANDADVDGDPLSLDAIVIGARRGRIVTIDAEAGRIIYQARRGTAGRNDSIVYRVVDGEGGATEGRLRLMIRR